jgi:hypothetical protein
MRPILASLGRTLRRWRGKSRAELRHQRDDTAFLYSRIRLLGPVILADWSETGAKLAGVEDRLIADAVYMLDPAKRLIHAIEVVWRSGDEAGVTYARSWSVRGYTDDASLQHIKAHWAEVAVTRSDD